MLRRMVHAASSREPVLFFFLLLLVQIWGVAPAYAVDPLTPEEVIRLLVQANATKDLATISQYMVQDPDVVGYTIGGRKYIGWPSLKEAMEEEFRAANRLEISITDLRVWQRDDVAWFAMGLNYIRYTGEGPNQSRVMLPLRETGVLERRNGKWMLHVWHESLQSGTTLVSAVPPGTSSTAPQPSSSLEMPDVSGEWEIQEEDKTYRATLDRQGNGTYTHKGGIITTTSYANRLWQGTWRQPENDREGGFEVLLSEDGREARGIWWYTRVGSYKNIPPRQHGGTYIWRRLTPPPAP
jgi:hypothetical protein